MNNMHLPVVMQPADGGARAQGQVSPTPAPTVKSLASQPEASENKPLA